MMHAWHILCLFKKEVSDGTPPRIMEKTRAPALGFNEDTREKWFEFAVSLGIRPGHANGGHPMA
jgi:hypothetical protein